MRAGCLSLKQLLLFFATALVASPTFAVCESPVAQLRTRHLKGLTLCELQSRYQTALDELRRKGIRNPQHIENIFAARFVNPKDWTLYIKKNGNSAFAAWDVYSPIIWRNWTRAVEFTTDAHARDVWLRGSTEAD